MPNISEINHQFSLKNQLEIIEDSNGLPMILVNNAYASSTISLYGGQILSFVPNGQQELLFLSEQANYNIGQAIRGGIPICWPWFGANPANQSHPNHGFARNQRWSLIETTSQPTGTRVLLKLSENKASLTMFPYAFDLFYEIMIGRQLELSLTTINTGRVSISFTQALHCYFAVGDIHQTTIHGLHNINYLDKNDNFAQKMQTGNISFHDAMDRIYLAPPPQLTIHDSANTRNISINSQNSQTTIVWNPWAAICNAASDLRDDAYTQFVCVETANTAHDAITLAPNKSFTLKTALSVCE